MEISVIHISLFYSNPKIASLYLFDFENFEEFDHIHVENMISTLCEHIILNFSENYHKSGGITHERSISEGRES
jgi:hypothetical protein